MNRYLSGKPLYNINDITDNEILILDDFCFENIDALFKAKPIAIIAGYKYIFSHITSLLQMLHIPLFFVDDDLLYEFINTSYISIDILKNSVVFSKVEPEVLSLDSKTLSMDGRDIKVYTSIKGEDVDDSFSCGADGIGLVSTEFLFYHHQQIPTKNVQINVLKRIFNREPRLEYTVRLYDINYDKTPKWFSMTNKNYNSEHPLFEKNFRDILLSQMSALTYMANKYSISILIPYVRDLNDVIAIKKIIKEYNNDAHIKLGVMIETCASIEEMKDMNDAVDFFSIGSNDLVQSYFGINRANVLHQFDRIPLNKGFWNKLKEAYTNAAGKDIRVCGQLPILPGAISKLIDIGFDKFTVSPHWVQFVKSQIQNDITENL